MISQASSEHSICFAIPEAQADQAKRAADEAFFAEASQGKVQPAVITPGCSILAVVGDTMVHHPGISGRFFGALGTAGFNVRAIAQGSSERNISAVIATEDTERALRAAHAAFYLSNLTITVGVIGSGVVGAELLRQVAAQIDSLRRERKIDVRVTGMLNSRKMLLSETGLTGVDWKERLEANGEAADLAAFVEHLEPVHVPHSVLIDATASADLPLRYPSWLERGIHVISSNKKANAGTLEHYRALREASSRSQRHFLYSTNVGAGLPILATLMSLQRTGDRVLSIEGVLSGTLSYLFNQFSGEVPFSTIVEDARARGYTEPDPRDDLSGMDVARKLVILARETGLELELDDVQVENLVPAALRPVGVAEFLKRLGEMDAPMLELLERTRDDGNVLRHVGRIGETGRAEVGLQSYPARHPFARLGGSDNIVLFRTERYDAQPLVIQGPGAGPEVTSGGVFADLLKLASFLGAAP